MFVPTPGLDLALQRWWSRWVLRGRIPDAEFLSDEAGWVLRYTARYRFTAIITSGGFTALYGLALVDGAFKTATLRDTAIFAGSVLIWLLFAVFLVTSRLEHVVVTPALLKRRSWRGRQQVPWSAVNLVEMDRGDAFLKVGVKGGTVIAVSVYLDGLSAVTDAVRQHLRRTIDLSPQALCLM